MNDMEPKDDAGQEELEDEDLKGVAAGMYIEPPDQILDKDGC